MDDTSYIKSKDAGNYRFNPYCDAVEIFLKRKNNANFDFDFKVAGNVDNIKVTYKKYKLEDWSSNQMKLTPKDNIHKLVEFICKKRQVGNLVDALRDCLERLGEPIPFKIYMAGNGQIIRVYMSSLPSSSRSKKLSNRSRITRKSTVATEGSTKERRNALKLQILTKFSDTVSTVVMVLKQLKR